MERKRSSDIDLLTLAIAAVAGAVAAYVTSKVWAGGTLFTAAMTPVIVALVREALARPVDAVASRRSARSPEDEPAMTVYGRSRRWIRVGILSGLAAFALVVAVFTIPELVAGESIGRRGDSATTLFGGKERSSRRPERKNQRERPEATVAPAPADDGEEPVATPSAAPTVAATPSPTAAPTVTAAPSPTPAP